MHIRVRRFRVRRLLPAAQLILLCISLLLGDSSPVLANDAADRAALEAAAQGWAKAFNARDAEALVTFATQDVVLMDPNLAPASGREAARAAWRQAVAASRSQITTATKELVVAGDVAWRIGAFTHKLPGGDVAGRGQSLEIWKRVNGQWKIHRQMSSAILVQEKLLPRPLPAEPILDKPALDKPSH